MLSTKPLASKTVLCKHTHTPNVAEAITDLPEFEAESDENVDETTRPYNPSKASAVLVYSFVNKVWH